LGAHEHPLCLLLSSAALGLLAGRPPRRKRLSVAAVEEALRSAGGDKVAAAKILGVSRATLYRHLPKRMGGS
jgi:transcriptional regulator of acetoin/glycerol metabolism